MPTLYLSQPRYDALRAAAEACGFNIGRGPKSQLGGFIEHLLKHEPIGEYNAIFANLRNNGLDISSDAHDFGDTWHYRWLGGKPVRGFATPAAALIAALQELAS